MNWYKEAQFGFVKKKLLEVKDAIANGAGASKEMVQTYSKWLAGRATPEEVSAANDCAKDLLKGSVLASLFILPGGALIIFALVKIAKKFGIELISTFGAKGELV
jgi:hypothetical protein